MYIWEYVCEQVTNKQKCVSLLKLFLKTRCRYKLYKKFTNEVINNSFLLSSFAARLCRLLFTERPISKWWQPMGEIRRLRSSGCSGSRGIDDTKDLNQGPATRDQKLFCRWPKLDRDSGLALHLNREIEDLEQ